MLVLFIAILFVPLRLVLIEVVADVACVADVGVHVACNARGVLGGVVGTVAVAPRCLCC